MNRIIRSYSVYVHYPYCRVKCPYCAFNKYVNPSPNYDAMINAYKKSLSAYSSIVDGGSRLKSLYFGGGTPSLAPLHLLDAIVKEVTKYNSDEMEITLEMNPVDYTESQMKDWKSIGINRLSMGIQSLRDENLKFLGREHDRTMALKAIDMAKKYFPGRVSLDFMFGTPMQTPSQWREELEEIVSCADDHLSIYQLTLENATPFFKMYKDSELIASENELADMYDMTRELLGKAGFEHYEVSSFGRNMAKSQHNMGYWRGDDYIGIGPGAHGRITVQGKRYKTVQEMVPEKWQSSQMNYERMRIEMTNVEVAKELIMFGLRTMEGVNLDKIPALAQVPAADVIDFTLVDALVEEGLVLVENNFLKPTVRGIAVVDGILARIIK